MSSHHKLESLIAAYGDAVEKGDAEAVARLFTEDAIVLPPNRLEIRGRQAIQDFYSEIMGAGGRKPSRSKTSKNMTRQFSRPERTIPETLPAHG